MNILVINAGSSSLKYQLMNPDTGDVTAKGLCERIGLDGRLTHKVPATGKKVEKDIPMPTHKEAIEAVMAILVDPADGVIKSVDEIDAVSICAHKFFLSAIGLRPFLFDLQSKHTVSAGTKLFTISNKEAPQNKAYYKHISPENVCACWLRNACSACADSRYSSSFGSHPFSMV